MRKCTKLMNSWWNRFKWRLVAFTQGRYGQDRFSKYLLWFSVAMWILSLFFVKSLWQLLPYSLGWLSLMYGTFRTFSRNIPARHRELAFFERVTNKPRRFFKLQKNKWRDRKTHRYFKCTCGASLRVPKGKGEIVIKCPKCGARLNKKT